MKIFIAMGEVGCAHRKQVPHRCVLVTLRTSYFDLPGGHGVLATLVTERGEKSIRYGHVIPAKIRSKLREVVNEAIASGKENPFSEISPYILVEGRDVHIIALNEEQAAGIAYETKLRVRPGFNYPGDKWQALLDRQIKQ